MKMNFTKSSICLLVMLIGSTINAQGPNAPEAASFEPVDATDMVNLNTGAFTYVLPLMNIPSPESGYPIAMSYHAGIAVDQHPSWVGLGWSLNPGAINRSVNGYPDDYHNATISEYFFDRGDVIRTYYASLSYSTGAFSVGVGASWGSHQSVSGYVSASIGIELTGIASLGVGGSVGFNQASSLGVGASIAGFSFGVNASTNGTFGIEVGVGNDNGTGFSIGANTNGTFQAGIRNGTGEGVNRSSVSLGLNFSSNGIGLTISATHGERETKTFAGKGSHATGGAGISMNLSQQNAVAMGDYITNSSSAFYGLMIPTPIGVFSAGFGKQKFEYYMGRHKENYITGPLNFNENTREETYYKIKCETYYINDNGYRELDQINENGWFIESEKEAIFSSYEDCGIDNDGLPLCETIVLNTLRYTPVIDVHEFPIEDHGPGKISDVISNNLTFPSYDSYNVQAQGLSGTMTTRLYENGNLFERSDRKSQAGYSLNYIESTITTDKHPQLRFDSKPFFEFDNEITNYLEVKPAVFESGRLDLDELQDYFKYSHDSGAKPRRSTSSFIQHYTYNDIEEKYDNGVLLQEGFLFSDASLSDNELFQKTGLPAGFNGIAAFKITAIDGKTYHYSLPVYNHETVTRTIGIVEQAEEDGYFEKRQLVPYATHWLLTAVTGPDFIDVNANGTPDQGDYGYWTSFEYGKWSEGSIWRLPSGDTDYIYSDDNPEVKTRIFGRKEVYYLDRIKTRTHTAVFVKAESQVSNSFSWRYNSVNHIQDEKTEYLDRFYVPVENSLILKEIVLLKNEDDTIDKGQFGNESTVSNYHFPQSIKSVPVTLKQSIETNVILERDVNSSLYSRALKVVSIDTDEIQFKGKGNSETLPPYKFSYHSGFDSNSSKDNWGYTEDKPEAGSLHQITTPTGSILHINYEENNFLQPVIHKGREFHRGLMVEVLTQPSSRNYYTPRGAPRETHLLRISGTDETDAYLKDVILSDYFEVGDGVYIDLWLSTEENREGHRNISQSTLDVLPQLAAVISMSAHTNSMVVEVNASSPFFRDYWELEEAFGIDNATGVYIDRENQQKGRYGPASATEPGCCNRTAHREYSLQYTIVGNKSLEPNQSGGGIRVKSISSLDEGNRYAVNYNYEAPSGNSLVKNSSGVVSYIPVKENEAIPYASELPAPRVMYEYVTVEQEDGSKKQYHFNVLKRKDSVHLKFGDFYNITLDSDGDENNRVHKEVCRSNFTVHDNLASLGQLLSIKTFNNREQLLHEQINNYHTLGEMENGAIGVVQESFQVFKAVDYELPIHDEEHQLSIDTNGKWFITAISRIRYPSILKSTKTISGGFEYTTEFLDFNLMSGQARKTRTYNASGDELMVESTPAFEKYPELGSKVDNINFKHMLSQPAKTESTILDKASGLWKPIQVDITTWNNNWTYRSDDGSENTPSRAAEKIWRKHKKYIWKGDIAEDGTYTNYDIASDDYFNWGIQAAQTNSNWQAVSETTLYNHFSKPLEVKDINANYSATKMCDNQTKVAAVCNAAYAEMFYTGAEYPISDEGTLDPQISLQNGAVRSNDIAHTGNYCIRLNMNQSLEVNLTSGHRAGKYKVSFWACKRWGDYYRTLLINEAPINGEKVFCGDWVLLNHYLDLDATAQQITVSSTSVGNIIDDFRVHPITSAMTSYVYNQWDELSYLIAPNGLSTKYEYDTEGRLVKTYSEVTDVEGVYSGGFKEVSTNEYHYKN